MVQWVFDSYHMCASVYITAAENRHSFPYHVISLVEWEYISNFKFMP